VPVPPAQYGPRVAGLVYQQASALPTRDYGGARPFSRSEISLDVSCALLMARCCPESRDARSTEIDG